MYVFHSKRSTPAERPRRYTGLPENLKTSRLCHLRLLGSLRRTKLDPVPCLIPMITDLYTKKRPPSTKTTIQVSATQLMCKRKRLHNKQSKNSLWIGSINQETTTPLQENHPRSSPSFPGVSLLFPQHSLPPIYQLYKKTATTQHNA